MAEYPRPATLADLLALDASRRVVGVTDGLVPLEALEPQSWDFSAPTLVEKSNSTYTERSLCPDSKAFAEEFYRRYPVLEGVPLDGILIAGSSVGQFLPRIGGENRAWYASDVDLFIHGPKTVAEADARIRRFVEDLEAAHHARSQAALVRDLTNSIAEKEHSKHDDATLKWQRMVVAGIKDLGTAAFENVGGAYMAARSDLVRGNVRDNAKGDVIDEAAWLRFTQLVKVTYSLPSIDVVRTSGSITIKVSGIAIQLVLRLYSSPSEILHGFDIGAAACGFDGERVVLTELGRFAYEYGYNVVDTTRRSATYEARLRKYLGRGFDLILPALDIRTLSRRNLKYDFMEVADLPRFPFAYSKIDGNRIFLHCLVGEAAFGPSSDYDLDEEVEAGGFSLAYMNLHRLVHGKVDFVYAAEGSGFLKALDVLAKPPHLTLRMVQRLYDQFREAAWVKGRLNTRTIERYLPSAPLADITKQVYQDGRDMAEVLDEAFATQRAEATRLWTERVRDGDHSVLPWVTENPGGQQGPLTGSLNPIMEDPREWYGKYMTSPRT